MAAKNQRQGIPKPFSGSVLAKFPVERPIFWAGGQDTERGFDYVEPSRPPSGLMRIPLCVRFVIGGAVTQVNIYRAIYLGWFSSKRAVYTLQNTECTSGRIILGGEFYYKGEFNVVTEIATEYNANMSTEDAINLIGRTDECNFGGGTDGMLGRGTYDYQSTAFMYTCPPDPTIHTAPNWVAVAGLGALGPSLNFVPPASVFSQASANPFTPYAANNQTVSGHYFLLNLISGGFQSNKLVAYWTETRDEQLTEPYPSNPFSMVGTMYGSGVLELEP